MTSTRARWVLIFALFLAHPMFACTMMQRFPDDILTNEIVASRNGQFAAIVRWHERIPDFGSMRAGDIPSEEGQPPRESVTVALYAPRLIAEIPIALKSIDDVYVSDSGAIVALERLTGGGCYDRAGLEDPFVTVYTAGGASVGALKVGDVLSQRDLWKITYEGAEVAYEVQDEIFVMKVQRSETEWVERRIDLATAKLVDPKNDIFPLPRVTAIPVDITLRDYADPPADCAAAFYDKGVERLDSYEFYERAVVRADAVFPDVMIRARVRGPVIVDVVVSEEGEVLCTRSSQLPFGGPQAAMDAVKQWKFTPMIVDGRNVKFAGAVLFRFED